MVALAAMKKHGFRTPQERADYEQDLLMDLYFRRQEIGVIKNVRS